MRCCAALRYICATKLGRGGGTGAGLWTVGGRKLWGSREQTTSLPAAQLTVSRRKGPRVSRAFLFRSRRTSTAPFKPSPTSNKQQARAAQLTGGALALAVAHATNRGAPNPRRACVEPGPTSWRGRTRWEKWSAVRRRTVIDTLLLVVERREGSPRAPSCSLESISLYPLKNREFAISALLSVLPVPRSSEVRRASQLKRPRPAHLTPHRMKTAPVRCRGASWRHAGASDAPAPGPPSDLRCRITAAATEQAPRKPRQGGEHWCRGGQPGTLSARGCGSPGARCRGE